MDLAIRLPASDVSRWVEAVANVVHGVEDADVTAIVLHASDEAAIDSTVAPLDVEAESVDIDALAEGKSEVTAAEKRLLAAGPNGRIRGAVHGPSARG